MGRAAAEAGLAAVVARSDAGGTSFATVPLSAAGAASGGAPRAAANAAGPTLAGGVVRLPGNDAVPGDDSLPVPPAAPPVRVAVLAGPGREADARFLGAAARAAAAEPGLRLVAAAAALGAALRA